MKYALIAVLVAVSACGPGPEGPPGPQGPKGDPGVAGPAGPGGLSRRTVCGGGRGFGSVIVTAVHVRYDFADGSSFITCHVEPTNANRVRKDSFPIFFGSKDPESTGGDCEVRHDVDTADGLGDGKITFRAVKGAALGTATYRDLRSMYDEEVISMNCESEAM